MNPPTPTAYSYIRFSSKKQEEGDSIRRQTELTTAWANRNNVPLDTSLAPDRGVSAFKGRNRDLGALGEFLRLVDAGRVLPGSYLVVESLDRLTREEIQPALLLVLQLLQKGVRVVQLKPSETIYDSASDTTPIILMLVELSRGHSESKVKSERNTAAWDRRKQLARDGQVVLTKRLPPWIEKRDGKMVLVPDRVRVLKKMFTLALKGRGAGLIVRELEKDKAPTWGGGAMWRRSYVSKLLNARAVFGECQFYKNGEIDGDPIPGYFPVAIDRATWDRVQAAILTRKKAPGRVGKKVANLFTGLLWDAHTGGKMRLAWRTIGRGNKRGPVRVLIPAKAMEMQAGERAFRNDVFETAMLKFLKEISAADVTGAEPESVSAELAAELAGLDARIASIEAELNDNGDVPALSRVLRTQEAKRREVVSRYTAARRAEDNPLSRVWSEVLTLLDTATDEPSRLRLRALFLDAIAEVWVIVVATEGHKYCVAQVFFRSGVRRQLVIDFVPGSRTREREWTARTFTSAPADFDLRTPAGVATVEGFIAGLDE